MVRQEGSHVDSNRPASEERRTGLQLLAVLALPENRPSVLWRHHETHSDPRQNRGGEKFLNCVLFRYSSAKTSQPDGAVSGLPIQSLP